MNRTMTIRARSRQRMRALTLIEVMAALTISAGAVTTMLVAMSAAVARLHTSQQQLKAQHIARELVAEWTLEKANIQANGSGAVTGYENWTWSRSSGSVKIAEGVSATEVRLVLTFEDPHNRHRPWTRAFVWLVADEGSSS